jgi:uncharacterized alpha-E superfamily protein
VAFQLAVLADHVDNLPRLRSDPHRSAEQRIMMSALTRVRLADVHALSELEPSGTRGSLDRLLTRLCMQMRNLSDAITHTYLIHAGPSRQMGEIRPGAQL